MVRSSDGDIDFFGMDATCLERETLVPFLFLICQDCVVRTSTDIIKEIVFAQKVDKSYEYNESKHWRFTNKAKY